MFIRNAWYIAAWAHEVAGAKPLARTICNDKLVLFRDANGKAAALEDRCAHRGAPLSCGEMVPEGLQCGYHGPENEPFGATVEGMPVCVIRRGECCYAFEDMCTHELARLSKGFLQGDVIECPLHEAKFDITTGKALCPPAEGDVSTYEARIQGDRVLVKL